MIWNHYCGIPYATQIITFLRLVNFEFLAKITKNIRWGLYILLSTSIILLYYTVTCLPIFYSYL